MPFVWEGGGFCFSALAHNTCRNLRRDPLPPNVWAGFQEVLGGISRGRFLVCVEEGKSLTRHRRCGFILLKERDDLRRLDREFRIHPDGNFRHGIGGGRRIIRIVAEGFPGFP